MADTTTQPTSGSYLTPSFEHATVADAMHGGIVSCDPDATVSEVARIMASHHVHCLAVIGVSHQDPECGVWGVIADLDVLRAATHPGAQESARSLAQQPVVCVAPDTPLAEACELMSSNHTSHLVVVERESEHPIGILSTLDVAGILAWGEA